jgi:hypothetical protein
MLETAADALRVNPAFGLETVPEAIMLDPALRIQQGVLSVIVQMKFVVLSTKSVTVFPVPLLSPTFTVAAIV